MNETIVGGKKYESNVYDFPSQGLRLLRIKLQDKPQIEN